MNNEQNVNLVAITGMGGIGKTTLAQKIYNNQTIQNRYAIRMWLHISQIYSPSQLIKQAIRNAGGNPGYAETESELLPILANVISGKSFFLVLDDAWNQDLWVNLLQDPLKAHATRGFVLVTTRDQTIAMQMGAKHIHQATILSTKSSWEQLCRRAYLTDPIDIHNLEGVGVEIVKKCGGLPLAINVVAGVLAKRSKTKREWENVLKNNTWSINGLPKEINRALYLSYEDLSPQLKQCFLYCSLYPSNQLMYYRDIIEDWIAEGFIEQNENEVMEDNAEECYYELIRRHLLELEPLFIDNSRCRMHDLLRSLARYLSTEECFSGDKVPSNAGNISRLRRLFITETNETLCILGPLEPLKLRTFIISKCLSEIGSCIFRRLKFLRILSINEKGLQNIPDSIGGLIHLRELDLDRTSISNLPESIGSLTNLLFLKLSGCELLHTLPRGITRLCRLCHLNLYGTPLNCVPKGLGMLTKLTQVTDFKVGGYGCRDEIQDGWDLQELEGLPQLRRIWITKLERARNFSVVLANKFHLKELILHFSEVLDWRSCHLAGLEDEQSMQIVEMLCPPPCVEDLRIYNYRSTMLPSWMSSYSLGDFLSNLQYLILIGWSCCTDLPPLGMLPNLKYLRVQGASSIVRISLKFLGISVKNSPNLLAVFPRLEHLIFQDMSNWEEWVLSGIKGEKSPPWQLMPRIKELVFSNCPKLRALPDGLRQLLSVNEIIVKETNSIKSILDLTFECDSLTVDNNKCLEILSNLPGVKRLIVDQTNNLRQVSKLESVEYIGLVDYTVNYLPLWLVKMMEERIIHSEYKLDLELFCNKFLFERCLRDGPEWPIIKSFSSVNIYNAERNASLQYTKEPESYFASL